MNMTYEKIEEMLTAPGLRFETELIESETGHLLKSWKNAPRTLADILRLSASYGDADFIVYGDERWSFAEHYARVAALSHRLVDDYGIAKGDRVAIAMRNYPEWCCAFWAAACAGSVVVPLNAWWTGDEMAYGLRDSGARVIFVDRERLERLEQVRSSVPDLEHVVAVRCEQVPERVAAFSELADGSTDLALPDVDIQQDDGATLFYTSGTTGFPKGTLGTHRNFCSVPLTCAYIGAQTLLRSGGKLEELQSMANMKQAGLLTVPLFHVTGCHGVMLGMLSGGGKLVMMYKWDPAEALDLIEREQVTQFTGVPTMVWQLLDAPGVEHRDLSSILNVGYGGAPAAPELLRRIQAKIPGAGASNGWGITETSSAISMIGGLDYLEKPDSVGPPVPVCEVKVVDGEGRELPPGELGELWVRGPNVVSGYWNKPEATTESFACGWFHTGDVGSLDHDGCIYIVDRLKDMIIRGGENVYCSEVEAALMEHRSVKGACVFGTPHEVLGEEVAAVVEVGGEGELMTEDIQRFLAGKLAKFKVPARIWQHTEPLPVGATGKVQKKALKEHYTASLQHIATE